MDGTAIPRQHQLLSVSVVKTANRIASARLAYLDGSAAVSDFVLSNDALLVPGKEVEILAGDINSPVSLFKGIVVRHALKVRDHVAPQLVVECRHKAVKLTVGRKNAYYLDQTDADIISAIVGDAGLTADVASMSTTHPQQVQFRSTDWDFILSRARANGMLVITDGDAITIKAPSTGSASVTLQFGATILEFDGEIEARQQFTAVKSVSWDPAQQSLVEAEGADPGFTGPGNLTKDDLASVVALDAYELRHGAISEDEAKAWAAAEWLHSQINRVAGRAKCEGLASVKPGDTITIEGVGKRFSGDVFVTGVRHDYDAVQGWKTHLQFGGVDDLPSSDDGVSAPAAGQLLPAVQGLQIGVVSSNVDPKGEHRIQVKMPVVDNAEDGIWVRVASLDAGDDRGFFFRPEIGDEVVVGFLDGDPRQAVMLGMLHSSAKAAPLEGSDDNHEKVYQSRSKMKVAFNDDTKVMELSTPAGNKVTLTEEDTAITIVDQNGNKIEMTADGITIESVKALNLKAATEVKQESGTSFGLKSGTEFKAESGTSFSAKGGADLKIEGTASAELSCSASTTIKGGIVQIN